MAEEKGYLLGQRAADAVRDLINRRFQGDGPRALHEPRSAPVCVVRLLVVTPDAHGYYDAVIVSYDTATGAWVDGESIWVKDANP